MPGKMELSDDMGGDKKYVVSGGLKKPVSCKVLMLDGTESSFDVEENSVGNVLFIMACEHLNLLETDYFALSYSQNGNKAWLKKERMIKKQLKKGAWDFNFEVKFYPRDPCHLKEELTRYQVYLQVRVDILEGKLAGSFVTQAILASYACQSQLGDWNGADMGEDDVSNIRFCPSQPPELMAEVVELHKNHQGMPADEAEYMYLDNAKVISLFGCHFVDAKDRNGTVLKLGVSGVGFVCHKDRIMLRRHHWTKVVKISFRRNKFNVLLRPQDGTSEQVVEEYALLNRDVAKMFWRLSVEHHAFFRLKEPAKASRGLFTGRSTNYLHGATQFQAGQAAEGIKRQSINFAREYHTMGRGALDKAENLEGQDYQTATVDRTEETIAVTSTARTLDRIKKNKPSVNHLADDAAVDNLSKTGLDTPGDVFFQGQLGGNQENQQMMRVSMNVDEVDKVGQPYLKTPYPTESQRNLVSEDMHMTSSVHNSNSDNFTGTSNTGRMEDGGQLNGNVAMDDQDYDKMLSDAILGVTGIDQNLSVEKIEITKKE